MSSIPCPDNRVTACTSALLMLVIVSLLPSAPAAAACPVDADGGIDTLALERLGMQIGDVRIERRNVFDLADPEENNALYRLANRLHIVTREDVIRQQLLFRTGDPYTQRLVEESGRLLRRNEYLYDASVRPVSCRDGVVDVEVVTRDLWTLMPGLSVSRKGGENRVRVSVSETNLLGGGARVKLGYIEDVDRESTYLEFADRNLGSSWLSLLARVADNSDGNFVDLRLEQPFYALDAPWAGGTSLQRGEYESRFYERGEPVAEYRAETRFASLWFGRSRGLSGNWVRRLTAGLTLDSREFDAVPVRRYASLVPPDRELAYPWLGFEFIEDRFETTANREQMSRTEDFFLGTRVAGRLGYAATGFGADREAWLVDLQASRGWGDVATTTLLLSTGLSGRVEDGRAVNALWRADGRYYRQLSERTLFFATAAVSAGRRLDLDAPLQLGGDNGLRGYPLRYQVGDKRALVSAELRYFTDFYPFRLARVGAAVFADAGRTWGENPAGGRSLGWLRDVGVGLRFAPTRASGREIVHLDLAFPLDGDGTIDDVQILLESKRSF